MSLPLRPPLEPMLAKVSAEIPVGHIYEPKWDGFRCLVFRDRDDVTLLSRNARDLAVYFPELVQAILENTPPRCVLDGELVVVAGDRLDFTRLTERIHPAQSRIDQLSVQSPASLICWDLLALDDRSLLDEPFTERRRLLEQALQNSDPPVHITALTRDRELAQRWFTSFEGAGLDGVVAKPPDQPYQPGKRAMVKIKHSREADVVVAGYRLHRDSTDSKPLVGSLQLGLFDGSGQLQFVGGAAAFTTAVRAGLAREFEALQASADCGHPWLATDVGSARLPRAGSRWSTRLRETMLIWPMPVCTVGYDHLEGPRFRHTAQFRRWRPDRTPTSCTFDQLEEVPAFDLAEVLDGVQR